jgi:hypothetical protein
MQMKAAIRLAAAVAVLAAILALGTSRARASNPPDPDRLLFGQVGVVAGQTFQVNAVFQNPPEPDQPQPGAITVQFSILDDTGTEVASSTERILAGHSASLSFTPRTDPNGNAAARANLHGVVVFLPPPTGDRRVRGVIGTAEVFDNATGRTSFTQPPDPD